MAALREAKKLGAQVLSIVNVVGSSIARESDDVLYTWAGPEIAVATTKAYTTQMAVLHLLGLYFGDVLGTVDAGDVHRHGPGACEALPGQDGGHSRRYRRTSSTRRQSPGGPRVISSSSAATWTTPCLWRAA